MNKIVPVILCGGSGTRLWPLSRAGFPKQFLVLSGTTSLFQQALARVNSLAASDISLGETLIVTGEEHRFLALDQLREMKQVKATRVMDVKSAEFTKYAANAMLATRIGYSFLYAAACQEQ